MAQTAEKRWKCTFWGFLREAFNFVEYDACRNGGRPKAKKKCEIAQKLQKCTNKCNRPPRSGEPIKESRVASNNRGCLRRQWQAKGLRVLPSGAGSFTGGSQGTQCITTVTPATRKAKLINALLRRSKIYTRKSRFFSKGVTKFVLLPNGFFRVPKRGLFRLFDTFSFLVAKSRKKYTKLNTFCAKDAQKITLTPFPVESTKKSDLKLYSKISLKIRTFS